MAAKKPFSTRLPDDVRLALQTQAAAKGLTESDLGRMFIIEKLTEGTSPLASLQAESRILAAVIIAALSDTIDLDQAHELVVENVSTPATVTP